MNRQEQDILLAIMQKPFHNQRQLADDCGHSLGIVNRSIKKLIKDGYLSKDIKLTVKAAGELDLNAPKNAIILAAGYGIYPGSSDIQKPKALLEFNGEPFIDRIIKFLHAAGVKEIYIVVGFMKEHFEYLIDTYGVKLVINREYAEKNNLHSMKLVLEHLSNTYVIPCDVWCVKNPFRTNELYSWYMVSEQTDHKSNVRINRKSELVLVPENLAGNRMIGIAYLTEEKAALVRSKIAEMCTDSRYDDSFWEEALYEKDRMIVQAKMIPSSDIVEVNTYKQFQELDDRVAQLKQEVISIAAKVLHVESDSIIRIEMLKTGMTNKSFMFQCGAEKYIMRIPGEGTSHLINRSEEAAVYSAISGKGLCEDPVYLNPNNGYKIARFIEGVHCCDPSNVDELKLCMRKLKNFHNMKLKVEHEFDLFEKINYYESLWCGKPSVYRDYQKTKENVFSLRQFIEENVGEKALTHIDAVPDNFLFSENMSGELSLQLTDWEYAGMQDPHVDIAMFCIYSFYNKQQIDQLINIYFENNCPINIHTKIYCYIATCGLLWSNWCEYKRNLGVEFGEYALRQYRYAKDFYKFSTAERETQNEL